MVGNNKILFFVICFYSFFSRCSVQLLVNSEQHYQAVIGEQFEVDLIMKDLGKTAKEPLFSGDKPSLLQRTGLYMTSLNGKTEVKYTYQVRFDIIGTYSIGPVKIIQNGVEYVSNPVTITVSYGSDKKSKEAQKKDVFLELSVDTEFPVVGQEVTLTLSCFVKKKDVQIESIIPPQLSDLVLVPAGEHTVEDRIIDNVFYKVVTWNWKFVPEKPGDIVIPAASIMYTTAGKTAQHFFFSFMSPAKRIFSNAVTIAVQALPAYNKPVHGIGHFTNFSASLFPVRIMQGEAATLQLVLEGKGTMFPALKYDLSDIPERIKHYPAATKKEAYGYIFEYVVQAVEAGECVIPAQEFTFFNIKTKEYETISTTPLEMRITQNSSLGAETKKDENEILQKLEREQEQRDVGSCDPAPSESISDKTILDEISFWFFAQAHSQNLFFDYHIPWSLFFFIVMLLLLIHVGCLLVRYVSSIQYFIYRIYFFLYCFFWARYRLYVLTRKDDVASLYPLFRNIIATKYRCELDEIYKYISDVNKAMATLRKDNAWELFWNDISSPIYSLKIIDIQRRMKLYQDANTFLSNFTKILLKIQ